MNSTQLEYNLKVQNTNLAVLQECLKSINNYVQNTNDFENSKIVTELLTDVKTSLDDSRKNISNLENLKERYTNIENDNSDENEVKNYNDLSSSYSEIINTTSNNFNTFLLKYIKNSSFWVETPTEAATPKSPTAEASAEVSPTSTIIPPIEFTTNRSFIEDLIRKSQATENQLSIPHTSTIANKVAQNPNVVNKEIIDTTKTAEENNSLDNNVLLISEKKNKIFLPYTYEEANKILESSNSYRDIQDVINKNFTLPLDKHKNGVISRFKEAYRFMRKREKASVSDSLDLALDVAFNSKLNPAIILACKDLEQLDTYLDCLEFNELHKFEFFEVKYEFSPAKR